jgi:hypothetical protein
MLNHCPACGAEKMQIFYSLDNIPVHSVRLIRSKDEALKFPQGKLDLAQCPVCGFICNLSYNPNLQDYSAEYESTQAYSATFNSFASRLAQQLVDRYDLHGKRIIEIGCGQGEFISLLCELGKNQGIGFDPAFDPARSAVKDPERVEIIPDYYSEKYSDHQADFVCCKMTLEHIREVDDFIGIVRRSIGDQFNTTVFFQVPDVDRVLQEVAFWDVYYEHCSYFSRGSLARLFRSQGFEVRDVWRDYNDQYLMIEAHPAKGVTQTSLPQENDLNQVSMEVANFSRRIPEILKQWKQTVSEAYNRDEKTILWGSGSKGVAFLTTLDICKEIEYTVDVNPNKDGTYMAGTGQKVVSPDFLIDYRPDLVILMNPIYRQEVQNELNRRNLSPRIISVGEQEQ